MRARVFPNGIGIDEDEATGAAALQLGALIGRDIVIRQGEGSELHARPGERRDGRRRRPRGARLRAQLRAAGRGLTSLGAMDVGIGLPNAVRGVDRRGIVDWARRAEQAGFSSLGTIDRIVFPNYESLIALAARPR